MQSSTENGVVAISGDTYTLTFPLDRPYVYVDDQRGTRLMELFVLGSVHPLHNRDDTVSTGAWEVEETSGAIICSLRAASSLWDGKTYRFRCQPQRFTYEMEIEGSGRLAEVNYFGGYSSSYPRWGSGFFWSGNHFTQGFNPEPIAEETHYFAPASSAHIDLQGVPLPGKGDWFYTPPPFCFAFQSVHGWTGMGVEAQAGEHRWTEYRYHGGRGWHLSLSYEGHTEVQGSYALPAIGFDFGPDEDAVLEAHVAALQSGGSALTVPPQPKPDWWFEPIFCGWGSQCRLALLDGSAAPSFARQAIYEEFVATLTHNDVTPGIVVIDDKWQMTYGDNKVDEAKWPDLPGFIAQQHAAGRKVLLWLKAWDAEGVPVDECITNAAGRPLTVDPTNPAYQRRLRAAVRRMLAADGYDADGFKIDFTARIPSGPGLGKHGTAWGLELMKLLLGIIYAEAKQTKSDALVMTHTPNPYLADVLDMIRLNDTLELQRLSDPAIGRNMGANMARRARIAAIACPQAIIDTDNWPVRDRAAWRDYVRLQPELGVPSLYFVSHIDLTGEPLEAEDYALVRESWAYYRSRLHDRRREHGASSASAGATTQRGDGA